MKNHIVIAITLGVLGGITLFLQEYLNQEFIHPRNPDSIILFEYAIAIFAAHFIVHRNNNRAGFMKLFTTGFVCTLAVFFVMIFKSWLTTGNVIFNFNNITGPFIIAAGLNVVMALVISNLDMKTKVKTNPEVLDDLDY